MDEPHDNLLENRECDQQRQIEQGLGGNDIDDPAIAIAIAQMDGVPKQDELGQQQGLEGREPERPETITRAAYNRDFIEDDGTQANVEINRKNGELQQVALQSGDHQTGVDWHGGLLIETGYRRIGICRLPTSPLPHFGWYATRAEREARYGKSSDG